MKFRNIVLSVGAAAALLTGTAGAASAATAAPASIVPINNDFCADPSDSLCTWYGTNPNTLYTRSSGSFTRYYGIDGMSGYIQLKQAGTNLCLTWNATRGVFDEITCGNKLAQNFDFYYKSALTDPVWQSDYTQTCLQVKGNNVPIGLLSCGNSGVTKWFFG